MLNIKRLSAGTVCALILTSLAACGGDGTQKTGEQTSASLTSAEVTEVRTESELLPDIPDSLDLKGRIFHVLNGLKYEGDTIYFDAKETNGDLVNDASYERRMSVTEQLNCQFDSINISLNDLQSRITKSVNASSNDYDFILGMQYFLTPLALKGMYANLQDLPYIDIAKPWWSEEYIRESGIGEGGRYFLGGDISTLLLRWQSCVYFNKNLYQNQFGNPDELYQSVFDKTWTLDKLNTMSAEGYYDLNGDAKADKEDRYGSAFILVADVDHLAYNSGVRCTTRNKDGIPQLTLNNPHTIDVTEKAYEMFYENPGVFLNPGSALETYERFAGDQYLFMMGWLLSADYLRDMKSDFGIIPYPLFDENQEKYLSLIHDAATIAALPVTAQGVEETAAVLELLAYEGWKRITPAYYEITLKTKYSRDTTDVGMQILDIIHDAATTDFGYVYNYALDNIALIQREILCQKKNSDFTSAYAKKESRANKKFEELVDMYLNLNS